MRTGGKGGVGRQAAAALLVVAAMLAGGAGAGEGAPAAKTAETPGMELVAPGAGNVFASGQPDAAIKPEGGGVAFVCDQNKANPWPGVAVRPGADGKAGRWDLRPYAYVEALVENPNDETVNVALRVDDDAKLVLASAWKTANAKLPPHEVAAVRVWLTDLSYGRRYILQKEAISQVLLFGGLPGRRTPLVLRRLRAGGRAGDVPPDYEPLTIVRGDGALADFARPGQ
ncbi:MAG: hypothetical protein J6333_03465, partial [Planctomycetes bacterium]|nr:hypothetical protein [Planctomycetota bacterium]